MSTILVTGAHGFIGGYVVEELCRNGYAVVAFDRRADTMKENNYPEGTQVFLGDTADASQVSEAVAECDGWIHLAATLGTQETIRNPFPAVMGNVQGGLNILEAAALHRVPGVYIGVGNHWMNNPYSISKTMVERLIAMFNAYRGTEINIVRGMNAYGPRQRAAKPFAPGTVRKITPAFICRALSGIPIEVYGDGQQVSDMIWVGDLAFTLVRMLDDAMAGIVHDFAVECGPVANNTVLQMAEAVRDAAVEIGYPSSPIECLPMRPGEIPGATVSADTDTLRKVDIDPDKFITLADGIRRTVRWFHENRGVTWQVPE